MGENVKIYVRKSLQVTMVFHRIYGAAQSKPPAQRCSGTKIATDVPSTGGKAAGGVPEVRGHSFLFLLETPLALWGYLDLHQQIWWHKSKWPCFSDRISLVGRMWDISLGDTGPLL